MIEHPTGTLDIEAAEELEKQYDSALVTRDNGAVLKRILYYVAIAFAIYHIWTAGFGTPVEHEHMGIHLTGLFVMIFAGFPLIRTQSLLEYRENTWWRWGNVPLYDWAFAAIGVAAALFLAVSWQGLSVFGYEIPEQALRQGDPTTPDIILGTALVVLVLEITRRSLGFVLPMIILVFVAYALLGPQMPFQILKHPGVDWRQFINNMYFPQEGIFGVTLWVVSTVVFHFVVFGVVAQRMGLGQFFVDNAMVLAGRYTGGPAKVSVVSSAFFGTISGSSIANTVSTGSLTIPNMKRLGYPGHFAGGVEAASSAGGQITPPIMGAASFLMAEFLEVPYTTIVIAAVVPATMHYVGVLSIVHFTAKRLGLKGYTKDQLPRFLQIWREGWHTVLPLLALLIVLFSGYSPNMAAFMGLMFCIVVGFTSFQKPLTLIVPAGLMTFILWKASDGGFSPVLAGILAGGLILSLLHKRERQDFHKLFDSFNVGVQYALAVGAACAAVGIVVGVINTTGVAFRLGFMVTNGARDMAETLYLVIGWIPLEVFGQASIQQFLSLVLIAVACILMGAGLPTTALYIMLVSVAQPALAQLGVPPLATHMFVLYYGVISEITPPVCASAYAAAGIAGANPFRTGVSAFTLGIGKLMVPMVFVYAPTMLIVLPEYFTWTSFIQVSVTCAFGVFAIATAVSGFFLARLDAGWRFLMGVGGLLLVAPSWESDLAALAVMAPVVLMQVVASRRDTAPVTAGGDSG
ncbi:MAG: TRAP transporter fused permease subunit [Rhodospirillales bacterium]|nr:TRAP transporter fused permease subunit [Rhodospirillales bacterium]MDH3965593.1 TRAP transporter fused permease subunit [Rhodospirillales bacterium]